MCESDVIATVVSPRRARNSKRKKKGAVIGSFSINAESPKPTPYITDADYYDRWYSEWASMFPSQDEVLTDVEKALTKPNEATHATDQ
jgi:hypothetical protein